MGVIEKFSHNRIELALPSMNHKHAAVLAVAGFLLSAPVMAQNLHVAGKVGIATTSPSVPLHVADCASGLADCAASDASLGGGGFAMFGDQGSLNLTLDNNEIMGRNNGTGSALYINKDGGNLHLTMHAGTTVIGDASSYRDRPLWVLGGNDINLNDSGDGFIQAGADQGANLVIDNNEIMARNGSGPTAQGAWLYLNYYTNGVVRFKTQPSVASDKRLKTDIRTIDSAVDRLSSLRGVTWRWKDTDDKSRRGMGLIAQDVEEVFPEIVATDPEDGTKGVQYGALIGPLVEAVKELSADNTALRAEMKALREAIAKDKR